MDRTLRCPRPLNALRLWSGEDWPVASPHPDQAIAVEWAGRTGHPTSYALLGAARAGVGVQFYGGTEPFTDALPGKTDLVAFGLPDEYRAAVEEELPGDTYDLLVAAHGTYGSSPMAFRWAARLLRQALREPTLLLADDEALWRTWAAARDGKH